MEAADPNSAGALGKQTAHGSHSPFCVLGMSLSHTLLKMISRITEKNLSLPTQTWHYLITECYKLLTEHAKSCN